MEILNKMILNILHKERLSNMELNQTIGGQVCTCSCFYANSGGFTSASDRDNNYEMGDGSYSLKGCNQYIKIDEDVDECFSCSE